MSDTDLARGVPVDLVVMGEPQSVIKARIGEKLNSAALCAPLKEARRSYNEKPGTVFYSLEGTKVTTSDLGIGVVNPPQELTVVNGLVEVDLNLDGRREIFSSCATAEGINFTVATEKPHQGMPLWSRYYYLGYDMKPTCP